MLLTFASRATSPDYKSDEDPDYIPDKPGCQKCDDSKTEPCGDCHEVRHNSQIVLAFIALTAW